MVADGQLIFHPLVEWTGGGLYGNPQDLVRWARALYEGEAIAGNYLFDLLYSISASDPGRPEALYGLGVAIRDTPVGLSYGHMGFFPGYVSTMQYFPADRVAVALQINTDAEQPQGQIMPLVRAVLDGLDGVR